MDRPYIARVAAGVLLLCSATALADSGVIVQSHGSTTVRSQGKEAPLAVGSKVGTGDVVHTGPDGAVQINFDDDSLFSLSGDSELRVDKFEMAHNGSGGSAIFSLLHGGMRTVTGKVSKGPQDRYELRTSPVTIGVHGTAYSALICETKCAAKGYKPGVYVKDHSGVVILTNSGGKLSLRAGQVAYASSQASAAVIVKASPFDDPDIAAGLRLDTKFEIDVNPPRIEPEPPASRS